jgi:uncharacterized membrane protein
MGSQHSNNLQPEAVDVQTRDSAANGAVCYVFGILVPLVYLSSAKLRKSSAFLRFHCFQCLLLYCVWIPLFFVHVRAIQPVLSLLWLLCLVAWVMAMVKADRGKMFRIPGIGALAERLADW